MTQTVAAMAVFRRPLSGSKSNKGRNCCVRKTLLSFNTARRANMRFLVGRNSRPTVPSCWYHRFYGLFEELAGRPGLEPG